MSTLLVAAPEVPGELPVHLDDVDLAGLAAGHVGAHPVGGRVLDKFELWK